jgi:NAD(P) transhydrogenase subunit alpha
MNATAIIQLYVFVLAGFVGFLVITRVPPLLHTPLMSATNAISAISLVGSLVVAGANRGTASTVLGFIAVTAAIGVLIVRADRRRRHAGGDFAAQLLRRPGGVGHRVRAASTTC